MKLYLVKCKGPMGDPPIDTGRDYLVLSGTPHGATALGAGAYGDDGGVVEKISTEELIGAVNRTVPLDVLFPPPDEVTPSPN